MIKLYSASSSKLTIRFIICFLSCSILLSACHSYYTIPEADYHNLEKTDDIKVVYKNKKEFVIEKDDTTNIKIIGDSLVVSQGSQTKIIEMSEVEKIKENRFDLGGTITVVMIPLIIITALFFASFDPGG